MVKPGNRPRRALWQPLRPLGTALALLLLAACTAGTPSGAGAPGPSPTPTLAPPPTARPTATAVPSPVPTPPPAPRRGGTLRIAAAEAPEHFDVQLESSPALATWGPGLAYSRLFRFAGRWGDAPSGQVIECELCDGWEMLDPTTVRVTLRQDVNWQQAPPLDGRALQAADIVFSYERQRTPGWPNAGLLDSLKSVETFDPRTVDLTMIRPDSGFLASLADSHSRIVAPEAVEQNGDLRAGPVVGSGPWVWNETTSARSRFVANPDYFEPARPRVDALDIVYLSEGMQLTALLNDFVDAAQLDEPDLTLALDTIPELHTVDVIQPGSGLELAVNTNDGVFADRKAREALFSELRPWEALDAIWGGDGFVSVGLPVPDASWLLSDAELRQRFARFTPPRGRPGALSTDHTVEIVVGEYGERYLQHAGTVLAALTRLGVGAKIRTVPTREFGDDVWFGGKYEVFVGAQPPIASLNDYLLSVYHSKGAWNTTGYSTPELDKLIEAQAVEMDQSLRRAMVLEIQRRIIDGAHRFSPATRIARWAAWPRVTDFYPYTFRGESRFLAETGLQLNEDGASGR